ncbi:MAG TPA: ABC transporter permease, partial [Anaerolineae bacterium]|nr:ABC transporter permease [Anaerolineae bacterium]
ETLNSNMRVFLPSILLAIGQAVVVLAGGIDISVGSIVSIVNTILATQLGTDASPEKIAAWMVIVLLVGMAAGTLNGFFIAYLRLQPIITTYATSFLFAGVALYILPNPGGAIPAGISTFYRDTTPLNLPLAFFVILVILLGWSLIMKMRYGRYLYAVGGQPEAAYATAVPVNAVQFSTYVFSGFMAALAGIALTLLVSSGNAGNGDALTLPSISAVVIGGTALRGGIGGVAGPIMGAVILGLIKNIISFGQVDLWWQTFANAAIIVLALAAPGLIDLFRRKRS